MEYKDYYQTLGVPRSASQAEVKKAFRKLARQHHPDRNPGDKAAEQRFKDVNEANEVLSDPQKRARYDQLGADWDRFQRAGADPFAAGGPFAGYAGSPGGVRYEFRSTGEPGEFSDFFNIFFGGGTDGYRTATGRGPGGPTAAAAGAGFDEILAGMGLGGRTGSGRRGANPVRPGPVEAEAEISLEEAYGGTKRLVDVAGRRLEVAIPRGVATGSRVRLAGQGPGGLDLVVVVRVRSHPVFTRHGRDLERELAITLQEALLGGEVPVGTLKGRVLLTIPAGTQNGRRFRLAGQGMPDLKGSGSGDLFVRARVVLPTELSDDAKHAARRFLELARQTDPRGTN